MNFIIQHRVYDQVYCWMYSVKWENRGLSHANILVQLVDKIRSDEIDSIISTKIPDETVEPKLHEIVTNNMIRVPCGVFNINSPCRIDGKYSNQYLRDLISDTITRNVSSEICKQWWRYDYFHCNKCKRRIISVSDKMVFYYHYNYISNEGMWRIFSFAIHERYPIIAQQAVENGQRVYFNRKKATELAAWPLSRTLTSFFSICQTDAFAHTLLYAEMPRYYT